MDEGIQRLAGPRGAAGRAGDRRLGADMEVSRCCSGTRKVLTGNTAGGQAAPGAQEPEPVWIPTSAPPPSTGAGRGTEAGYFLSQLQVPALWAPQCERELMPPRGCSAPVPCYLWHRTQEEQREAASWLGAWDRAPWLRSGLQDPAGWEEALWSLPSARGETAGGFPGPRGRLLSTVVPASCTAQSPATFLLGSSKPRPPAHPLLCGVHMVLTVPHLRLHRCWLRR